MLMWNYLSGECRQSCDAGGILQKDFLRMERLIIGFLAGLAVGTLAAFLNSRITKILLLDDSGVLGGGASGTGKVMMVNVIRLLVSALTLLVIFLVRKYLPFSFEAAMLGAAAGLTFISYLFLWLTVRNKK